jgi:mRNA-degrading endonuclease RelE of RelBE toxin-antitoxin system
MYRVKINLEAQETLDDLKRDNPIVYENVVKKINQIAEILEHNPNHCKPLKKPLSNFKRVHVNTSFVLIFKVDQTKKLMTIYAYEHHKKVYKKRWL